MNAILHHIKLAEERYEVKILYACETGSRAWGFPSPDSDFDIRFIYMHEKNWYLNLGEQKDTIEYMDGDLDITGWDLRKSLKLLKKSNVPLVERFQSPIVYFEEPGFKKRFSELVEKYYSPTASFYHHHSLAVKFWEHLKEGREYKLKNFFYLVRSLLSCNWIIQDDSVLPMQLEGLMKYADDQTNSKLRALVRLKETVGEKYLHKRDRYFDDWIQRLFIKLGSSKTGLAVSKEKSYGELNEFFLNEL